MGQQFSAIRSLRERENLQDPQDLARICEQEFTRFTRFRSQREQEVI